MRYIREPKNVDLVIGPSVLTEETKQKIGQAIARYKSTGEKTVVPAFATQGSVKISTYLRRVKSGAKSAKYL